MSDKREMDDGHLWTDLPLFDHEASKIALIMPASEREPVGEGKGIGWGDFAQPFLSEAFCLALLFKQIPPLSLDDTDSKSYSSPLGKA